MEDVEASADAQVLLCILDSRLTRVLQVVPQQAPQAPVMSAAQVALANEASALVPMEDVGEDSKSIAAPRRKAKAPPAERMSTRPRATGFDLQRRLGGTKKQYTTVYMRNKFREFELG
jgi:hypothetical protein